MVTLLPKKIEAGASTIVDAAWAPRGCKDSVVDINDRY
jgi:hypothetical protein